MNFYTFCIEFLGDSGHHEAIFVKVDKWMKRAMVLTEQRNKQ